MLERKALYTDAAGRQRRAPRSELLFRKQVERALGGDLRSLKAVLRQFITYDAVQLGQVIHDYGAIHVPSDIPMPLAWILAEMHGHPPWSIKEIAQGCVQWERQNPDAANAYMAERFGRGRQ